MLSKYFFKDEETKLKIIHLNNKEFMSDITKLIKDLRNKTGAGFLDCKNALSQNDNNIEKAVVFKRKRPCKASKKTSREANEGAVGIYNSDNINVILK